LVGVYNINKGYADFRQIKILYQNDEYSIVKSNTTYGLAVYDYIVLDSSLIDGDGKSAEETSDMTGTKEYLGNDAPEDTSEGQAEEVTEEVTEDKQEEVTEEQQEEIPADEPNESESSAENSAE
nr:hypothetical protein [Butyrivibrio sp.]